MNNTLKLINSLIANTDPTKYDNIAYTRYYKDMTSISTKLIDESAECDKNYKLLLIQVNKLPESTIKDNILRILEGPGPGGTTC